MAYFEGTIVDFYTFLGPRTSDLVFNISKPYRKKQKSCKDENEDGKACGKWKRLDAAHLKNRTRKIIIKEILEEFGEKMPKENYKISLEKFETEFNNKHKDFFNVIQFRCRKHHRAYDKINKVEDLIDHIEVETEDQFSPNFEIDFNTKSENIKQFLISQISYLKDDNCRIAKVSTENWNFNSTLDDLKKDFYLLCYNQTDFSVIILKTVKNKLEIQPKASNKNKISLNIPYSETEFTEKKTGYEFEFVESFQLKP